ncbi:response regulator transcription factor [Actinomycetospora sp. NBRC 106378]|uniref:response regulator transcription factor n=1 Tax=Actinomycetospora sp. NBRC 106378 TaxID=3032208 RepID=UPI0024A35D49|nr:response regulator transcription factor [Actinomycetospora sp. NBRC 106378]GLZ52626.1 DNA-binding response regulator [Actinomycetospora sp. NBRC 106378]
MRVALAEDSLLLREGLVRLLDELGANVVAAVGDGAALVDAVDVHDPDVAVIDVRMPPTFTDEGLRAALDIRARRPATAVLVLSQYVETSYATELLGYGGGVGYLLKDRVSRLADLADALERIVAGGTVLDPEVVSTLFARRDRPDRLSALTPRERDVLAGIAEGRTNSAVARALAMSRGTIEKHISSIFAKLGLQGPSDDDHRRVLAVLAWLGVHP